MRQIYTRIFMRCLLYSLRVTDANNWPLYAATRHDVDDTRISQTQIVGFFPGAKYSARFIDRCTTRQQLGDDVTNTVLRETSSSNRTYEIKIETFCQSLGKGKKWRAGDCIRPSIEPDAGFRHWKRYNASDFGSLPDLITTQCSYVTHKILVHL